jgi:hypothetical protein
VFERGHWAELHISLVARPNIEHMFDIRRIH